jgi:hypothetical protein
VSRLRVTASYEYDVEPGDPGYDDCKTAADCVAIDAAFAEDNIVRAIHDGDATFVVAEVKGKK